MRLDWCDPGMWRLTQPLIPLPVVVSFDSHVFDIVKYKSYLSWCQKVIWPILSPFRTILRKKKNRFLNSVFDCSGEKKEFNIRFQQNKITRPMSIHCPIIASSCPWVTRCQNWYMVFSIRVVIWIRVIIWIFQSCYMDLSKLSISCLFPNNPH